MNQKDISLFDMKRILIGDTPWSFLLEVAARGIVIYVALLVTIRFMGKRVAGQLSLSELAIMVTLGAAIGIPMEVADRGLLPALVVLLVAIVYQRGIGVLSFKRRSVEMLTQGDMITILGDGLMDLGAMRKTGVSRERLYAALRGEKIVHLGEVERVYMETSGSFSVYRRSQPIPGLQIVPRTHPNVREEQALLACESCGNVQRREEVEGAGNRSACPRCQQRDWHRGVSGDEPAS